MTHNGVNRRLSRRRLQLDDHGIVLARVRPGCDVTLIDISAGGALVESHHRLLPGAPVELHLERSDRRTAVRGRILRCTVSRLESTSVCYAGAIGFDRQLPWFADDEPAGYVVHIADGRAGGSDRADATHPVS